MAVNLRGRFIFRKVKERAFLKSEEESLLRKKIDKFVRDSAVCKLVGS
ncbi:hypothetical protein RG963_08840 [Methanosarcina sp. Z-7115]|uniref:Mobile element protein n=1 Tax=Methanosarcina baikalica TaxID=3073890 RepID=A0ABU2D1L7_9EURY|nr:hypothetical protein [Methanosarcina sp. Z-7115]MDR7665875.1 hypothetical protein [Methanosarcina sp. Z-7115]